MHSDLVPSVLNWLHVFHLEFAAGFIVVGGDAGLTERAILAIGVDVHILNEPRQCIVEDSDRDLFEMGLFHDLCTRFVRDIYLADAAVGDKL